MSCGLYGVSCMYAMWCVVCGVVCNVHVVCGVMYGVRCVVCVVWYGV